MVEGRGVLESKLGVVGAMGRPGLGCKFGHVQELGKPVLGVVGEVGKRCLWMGRKWGWDCTG